MKLTNTMFKLTALFFALTASLSAFAGGGGDGGKIQLEGGMAGDIVAKNLLKSKDPAFYALQALEFAYQAMTEPQAALDARKKLFEGQKTVYQALKEATIIPTNDEHACDGLPEPDPDACAFPDLKKIYFIIPRIVNEQVKDQSGRFQLVALVAHEAVHLIKGTTEAEAQLVQAQIQPSVSSNIYSAFPDVPRHIKGALDNALSFAQSAQMGLSKSHDKFCDQLLLSFFQISEASNTNSEQNDSNGILIIPTDGIWNIAGATAKMLNLMDSCDNVGKNDKVAPLFQNRSTVSMFEFYKAVLAVGDSPDYMYRKLPDLQIRHVTPTTTAATNAEIQDVISLLSKATAVTQ